MGRVYTRKLDCKGQIENSMALLTPIMLVTSALQKHQQSKFYTNSWIVRHEQKMIWAIVMP